MYIDKSTVPGKDKMTFGYRIEKPYLLDNKGTLCKVEISVSDSSLKTWNIHHGNASGEQALRSFINNYMENYKRALEDSFDVVTKNILFLQERILLKSCGCALKT